jgi:short-subunit dehydrogenase
MEKTVLVTGVSSGIGRATAALLATKGFRVFGTVRGELAGPPVNAELVRDDYATNLAVDEIIERAGPIDVLVNNAGYALLGAVEETTVAQAEAIVDANFFGVMRLTNAPLPFVRQRRWGRIVNIGSAMGFLPAPYMCIYAATEHALTAYSETLDQMK